MIAWNPLASVHTVHSAEALLGAELNMSMTRSWTALTEVTTKSRAFQALSQLLLAWPQPSHASMCLRVWFVPHGHIVVIGNPYLALLILSESCFLNNPVSCV